MSFSAMEFCKEAMKYEHGKCKDCKYYKTIKLAEEVQICILSDKFLLTEYEPNYTCKNFKKKEIR